MARRVPRVVCVHAMQASLRPTKRAFALGFPEAEVHDLLDSSLSVDVGGDGGGAMATFTAKMTSTSMSASTAMATATATTTGRDER